ncbi:hypothetical protein [Microbacterium hydrocarbonoxydans]|uniref:hypothetical protein n=1 Tax=Microbacterium hydrocarbonoxydans TaxID=273678 RepID=UPI003D96495A
MSRLLSPGLALLGVALLALVIWLDVRDGSPTMQKGTQPWEVVVTEGIGDSLLVSGLIGTWRTFKNRGAGDKDPRE